MSTLSHTLTAPGIEYPDTDGQPMAENTVQYRYLTTIKGGLEVVFRDRSDVFVAGDLFWYPVEGRPDIRTAPDVLVAIGRPRGDRGSYMQWREGGVPPQVIFEILSPGNRPSELIDKFQFYQRYGVEEYYLYDPEVGDLAGWERKAGELDRIDQMQRWVSPRLSVTFELDGNHLNLFGPDGWMFETYEEVAARAERESARAERESARAAREAERADRMATRLRELGEAPED